MIIKVNGEAKEIKKESNLEALIKSMGLCPEKIVMEHNLSVIPKSKWKETTLSENDAIEIVSFVAGG